MDNFLNFLDNGLNLNRRRNFFGVQDVVALGRPAVIVNGTTIAPAVAGIDAQGRYVIGSVAGIGTYNSDNAVNVSSSVWRLKVGISYNF